MVKLAYTLIGKSEVNVDFADIYAATEAAVALQDCPGIANVLLIADGCKPYAVSKKSRYIVHYSNDMKGERWNTRAFSYISDAARFGEQQMHYQVHDMFENVAYKADDLKEVV